MELNKIIMELETIQNRVRHEEYYEADRRLLSLITKLELKEREIKDEK